jgi:RimJ/RimL family protein N-acetyltransferase
LTDIPTLTTERLILRPYRDADFDAFVVMWQDPDVVRFIGGKPFTREESWTRFLRNAGMWAHLGFGFFAIEERATGNFVGEVGFQERMREIEPSMEGTIETGWGFVPDVHGWGHATEAVTAAVAWAGTAHPGKRFSALIDVDHVVSHRVAKKAGFREWARSTYHGAPVILFER